ncbi:MAG: endolytic transglycosylase MltG [Patescibacteria group bacterium]
MKKLISFLVLIILLIFFVFYSLANIYIPLHSSPGDERIVNLEKGQGSREITSLLKKEGLIKSKFSFLLYVSLKRKSDKLQSGPYSLNTSMNIPQIVEKLVRGDILKEKITIVEGWNLKDISEYFEKRGMFSAKEFFEKTGSPGIDYRKVKNLAGPKDFSQDFNFIREKPIYIGLEGYLFPDTYEIAMGENLENIIQRMLSNFDSKLKKEMREEIQMQGKSIFEIVTMASLIEKEVKTLEDKKIVSGILWKRLRVGMPLQVDATIIYLTGKRTTKVSIEETQIDSPYNTYKNKGLPFGPIANPGLDSILAAIYPQESKYFYYLSMPDGKTIFSKTLKEHNLAKAKYLKP